MPDPDIQELIAGLAAKDGVTRQHARHQLEAMGAAAESALVDALGSGQERVRWEAAKALTRVATGQAAEALIPRLGDDNHGIRWLAAEALLRTGAAGAEALLTTLMTRADEQEVDRVALREGAHHVFHDEKDPALRAVLAPVAAALRTTDAEQLVPVAARAALDALRSTRS